MVINQRVILNSSVLAKDGTMLKNTAELTPEMLYRDMQCNYPKFFKMDSLCKWALLAAEAFSFNDTDKNRTAVVLNTLHGCSDADTRYAEDIEIPSPALFVYTLPNIMLGELCIRHGFKGEQLCMVPDSFDAGELYFSVADLVNNKGMEACLCGWADVTAGKPDIALFWVVKNGKGVKFKPDNIKELAGQIIV